MLPQSANEENKLYRIVFHVPRKKRMWTLPATCYKCRNTDRQGVSTQKKRSNLASVATCSKIPKVLSFAGFLDDSCYKGIPINKGLTSIIQMTVATVAST